MSSFGDYLEDDATTVVSVYLVERDIERLLAGQPVDLYADPDKDHGVVTVHLARERRGPREVIASPPGALSVGEIDWHVIPRT